ncbi:hypothetical protein VIBNIFTn2_390009 [Vibrio nigripulchritudo FTn2]|nr:hypothetical protein VIBNIFTn2_390009 [Vibrio nigripulchritudo FTn2]
MEELGGRAIKHLRLEQISVVYLALFIQSLTKYICNHSTCNYKAPTDSSELIVGLTAQLLYHVAPAFWCNERSQTFKNQHQSQC